VGQEIFITTSGGCLGAFSACVRGNLSGEGGRERFQPFGEAPQGVLRVIRAHQFPPLPIALLFLRLKVSLPGVVPRFAG